MYGAPNRPGPPPPRQAYASAPPYAPPGPAPHAPAHPASPAPHPAGPPPHPSGPRGGTQGRGPTVYGARPAEPNIAAIAEPTPPVPVSPVPAQASPDAPGSVSPALVSAAPGESTNPEQLLAAIELDLDPATLYETTRDPEPLTEIRDLLTARINGSEDNASRARLLGLRSVVARVLGDVRAAHADAKMALVHAEATGQLRRIAIAKSRLANVLVQLDEHAEADQLFAEANTNELPERLRAAIHHYAGKCAFAQNRYMEAIQHFEQALELRRDGDPELVAATEVALDSLFSRVAERGWGPYPRPREEILRTHRPPVPQFDEGADRWGYQDANGNWPIPPQFADVQPFRDGVAWIRPVGLETWGLIDEAGRALIHPANGFLGVASFSDGLAWVSRDGVGGWLAIDKAGRVLLGGNFDDVRPFRRGIAAVRQNGKWGAVERTGRLVVPFAFDAFATGLADGRYVDGFTDEGLAVVEVGGRKGVIDRTGRQVVPPVYPTVVVHPVAYLIVDDNHRWGALDRHGRPLIDPVHASRSAVGLELEDLMADSRPLL